MYDFVFLLKMFGKLLKRAWGGGVVFFFKMYSRWFCFAKSSMHKTHKTVESVLGLGLLSGMVCRHRGGCACQPFAPGIAGLNCLALPPLKPSN